VFQWGLNRSFSRIAGIACFLWLAMAVGTFAEAQGFGVGVGDGGMGGRMRRGSRPDQDKRPRAPHGPYDASGVSIVDRPPHGGQISKDLFYYFEVVYQPQATRVYIYGPAEEPLPAQAVRGQVVMKPHYLDKPFPCALQFAAPAAGEDANQLVAAVDVRGVPDGELTATFQLDNLFLKPQPQSTFTQTFALTKPPPQVVVAALTEADRPDLERQQLCPVTGARLSIMSHPVKVLIDGQPVYLCCENCIAKVQQNPRAYVPTRPTIPAGSVFGGR
jgi:hypothetical protein